MSHNRHTCTPMFIAVILKYLETRGSLESQELMNKEKWNYKNCGEMYGNEKSILRKKIQSPNYKCHMFSHMRINSLLWYVSCTVPVQTRKQGKKWGCREVAIKDEGMIIGPK